MNDDSNQGDTPESALLHALLLDGSGGARALDPMEISEWQPSDGVLWLHFDYSHHEARQWFDEDPRIDPDVADILMTEETRPRASVQKDSVLLALRGVNLYPDANPEDMVALRIWATGERIISTRRRRLLSVSDIREALLRGEGPACSGEVLVSLASRLIERMQGTIDSLDDRVADVENEVIGNPDSALRSEISAIRRATIMLRRYLSPQREALSILANERLSWMQSEQKLRLREVIDSLVRHVEDLDSTRDRAAVTQEELVNHQSELMNQRMYVLSLVSAIFLPLGFLTGLLGVNVGGIPFSDSPWGFSLFMGLILIISLSLLLYFRKRRWL